MRWGLAAVAAVVMLGGCTTDPVPEGLYGPVAKISDSFNYRSDSACDFFVLR